MRLRRIAVRNFRKLAGPVVIDRIGNGLTLLAGDNEEGKSTVLAALKAALFEHHQVGGGVRERMTPLGSTLVPEVELDFELGGAAWRLRKAFRRGGVQLEGPGVSLLGDEAEDRLLALLRFQRRQGRADARPEHHGLSAVFWVDQGTGFRDFHTVATARERIAGAVSGEVERVTGGAAAVELAARVRERCDRYWTPKFAEKGALKELAERCQELAAAAAELRRRMAEAAEKEARLARLREPAARLAEAQAREQARARKEEAERRLAGIAALEQQAALAGERLKAGQAALARADAELEQRRRLRESVAAEERRLAALELALHERREAVAAGRAAREQAEAADRKAREAQSAADAERERLLQLRLAAGRAEELARLRDGLTAARAAADAVAAAEAALRAEPCTSAVLARVRAAQSAHDQAQAALAAVATTLELRPRAGATALRDGRAVDPAQPLELTDRATLELDGWGMLIVTPGGTDIAARRSAAAAARDRLDAELRAAKTDSLAEAERRAAVRAEHERELARQRERLAANLAVSGLGSLDELAERVRLLALELPAAPPAAVGDDATAAAELAAQAAREAVGLATLELQASERRMVEVRQALALAEQEAGLISGRLEAEREQLVASEALRGDDALGAAAAETRAAGLALAGEVARLETELRLADREAMRDRLDIAVRELAQLDAEVLRRERAIVELASELRALGDDGLAERLGEQEAQLRAVEGELARTRRDALAWKLLHDTLAGTIKADREALLAPVVARLGPWLRQLFPDAAPVLDPDSFAPLALVRGKAEEVVDSLSLGTREQIAILVRLGIASLLAEREGEAPCLILDDALVYADEGRFATMKAILQRAARELQILVLTCRPRDYFGLDARFLRLEDCRGSLA